MKETQKRGKEKKKVLSFTINKRRGKITFKYILVRIFILINIIIIIIIIRAARNNIHSLNFFPFLWRLLIIFIVVVLIISFMIIILIILNCESDNSVCIDVRIAATKINNFIS